MTNSKISIRIFFASLFVAATVISAAAQLKTGGEVVEVVDGKTVVVAVPTGRVTVELQYIDVPEPGQSLHGVVKDHVRTLLLGKFVELQANGFSREKFRGKLTLGGVDVSRQMLRDGAAWHVGMESTGQPADEFSTYAESESLARQEKRGVWSIANLEPAWEFRAKAKQYEPVKHSPRTDAGAAKSATEQKRYWGDKNPLLKDVGGMNHGFNAATKTGFLGTTLMGVKDEKVAIPGHEMAVDMTYYYTENGKKGRTGYFVISVFSVAYDFQFLKANSMTIEVDGKRYVIGKPKRETDSSGYKLAEKLTYQVDPSVVEKIANGGDVAVKIGNYSLRPRAGLQMILYNMLEAAK